MATLFPSDRDCDQGEDRISELPEDIILSFLSPMGMKEAVQTSVISKRWKYLWAKRTHLDFDHLLVLPDAEKIFRFTPYQKSKYIKWVNQVLGLHCSPCIDTFRVSFNFVSSDAHHIDKWVRFALLKKVKNLELNLTRINGVYTIGLDVLKPSPGVGDSGITFLKALHLSYIDVSDDILEYLLSRCCLLERLYVRGSLTLARLKVGLSCKLKQLTIYACYSLEELEIDAASLIFLEYFSANHDTNVVLKSMPMLVEAKFGGYCFGASSSIFPKISHVAAQISKLSLNLKVYEIPAGVLPTFSNLKQLNMLLHVDVGAEFDLVTITHFLKACPVLREFNLEISWRSDNLLLEAYELRKVDLSRDEVEVDKKFDWEYFESVVEIGIERTNHPNLKLLQAVGFSGCDADVNLILFLVVLASNLETIICDPSRRYNLPVEGVIEASRSRAAKLVKLIPPKINLVII